MVQVQGASWGVKGDQEGLNPGRQERFKVGNGPGAYSVLQQKQLQLARTSFPSSSHPNKNLVNP